MRVSVCFINRVKSGFVLGLLGSLLFCAVNLNAQTAALVAPNVLERFDNYRQNNYQEKLYVHLDKNFYLAGEIAWFKIYVTDAYIHQASKLSSVAYVELLDSSNISVLQAKISLEEGRGNGSFYLPMNLVGGNYQLRAYTSWMKNFAASLFYQKKVQIINAQLPVLLSEQPAADSGVQIRFYPEGGYLVRSLPSKVAVSIFTSNARGLEASGEIVDTNGTTVSSFTIGKDGIGSFVFTPQVASAYSVRIKLADHRVMVGRLPDAQQDGLVMKVEKINDNVIVQVTASENAPSSSAELYLLAHARQTNIVWQTADLSNRVASFKIPYQKLEEGITHFTIFNNKGRAVCERLFFKKPFEKKLDVSIAANKPLYGMRDSIRLNISAKDYTGKPIGGDFSLSVYRIDSLQKTDDAGIAAYFWLQSELGATAPLIATYLSDSSASANQKLDNLMLVYGYRRFSWNDVLAGSNPVFRFPPEPDGHLVTGRVMQAGTEMPAAGKFAYMSVLGDKSWMRIARSDEQGNIKFRMKNYVGGNSVLLQTNPEDSLLKVELNSPFATTFSDRLPYEKPTQMPHADALLERSIATQSQNVYNALRIRQYEAAADTTSFYAVPEATYLLDNYTRFTTLEEVFREYIPYVTVHQRQKKFQLRMAYQQGSVTVAIAPTALIDGVPIFDHNRLLSYDALKIKKIELVNRHYRYGDTILQGIISLSTYRGDFANFELDPKAVVVDYESLQQQRIFYSPGYETPQKKADHLPDFRNQLQWLPNVYTGLTGKQAVNFYSSDLPGRYVAVLQGMAANGSLGEAFTYFDVR